ncbi:MAG: LPS assembly lipoprotein LptE [Planctomycetota bacterium]
MYNRNMLICIILGTAMLAAGGCRYTAQGSLPEHIQTVRVPVFKCNKFYYGLESRLTRAIIEKLGKDPRVKIVNNGEDAVIFGDIVDVQRRVLRSDKDDRPTSIRLSISVMLTFRDKVEGKNIIDKKIIRSSSSSSAAGVYDLERDEQRSTAEAKAVEELAAEIARQTIGMW